jgi:predicted DNA-binding protein
MKRPGPVKRHDAQLLVRLPHWLKQRLAADADREARTISELARERLSAPYRAAQ